MLLNRPVKWTKSAQNFNDIHMPMYILHVIAGPEFRGVIANQANQSTPKPVKITVLQLLLRAATAGSRRSGKGKYQQEMRTARGGEDYMRAFIRRTGLPFELIWNLA